MKVNKKNIFIFLSLFLLGLCLLIVPRPRFLPFDMVAFAFECIFIVVSAIFFLQCVAGKLEDIRLSPVDILYGIVVILSAVSFFFLSEHGQPMDHLFIAYAALVLYFYVRLSYKRYVYQRQTFFLSLLVIISGVEASHGLIQFVSGSQMKGHFFNPNYLAMYAALHVPVAFALVWSKRHKLLQKLFFVCVTGLLLLCVLLSICRTALLGLILTLLLMFFVYYGHSIQRRHLKISKRSLTIYGIISVVAVVFITFVFFSLKPVSALGRVLVWKVSLRMFFESPIMGVGFGNFSSLYNLHQAQFFEQGMGTPIERMSASDVTSAFNDYVESAVEFGLVGLVVLAVFWVLIFRNTWSVFSRFYRLRGNTLKWRAHEREYRSTDIGSHVDTPQANQRTHNPSFTAEQVILGMAGSVLLFMIMSLFYSTSRFTSAFLIFNVFLACVVSANQMYRAATLSREESEMYRTAGAYSRIANKGRSRNLGRFLWIAFSSLAFLVSVMRVPTLYAQYKGGEKWYTAQRLNRMELYKKAIKCYRDAYPNLRRDKDFLYDFGKTLLQAGNEAEAIKYLEQCNKLWPSPFLSEDLATAYERRGDLREAVKNASLASNILPWRLTSAFMLADLYYRLGDATKALNYANLVVDTPMKIVTEKGRHLKKMARILQQNLKTPLPELRIKREKAMSLIPTPYRADVAKAVDAAGTNDMQLVEVLYTLDSEERRALSFLLANMPRQDLKSLTSVFLAANVQYAFKSRSALPYNLNIPEDIFLNYVLPYANVNERRDNWRADFYERFIEMARNSSSVEETAALLNTEMFKMLGINFGNRDPQEAIHSPFESMEKGYASCEGLSVLLVDACRAVGIPARLVFIPEWADVRGGHIWVEVYDDGRWHCMAAFDAHDPTWPCNRASRTDPSKSEHRIYAVSFERTGLHIKFGPDVSLIDVTDRYVHQENTR